MKDCDPWQLPKDLDRFLLDFDLIVPPIVVAYFEANQTALEHPIARFLYDEARRQTEKQSALTETYGVAELLDAALCAPCVSWCLELLMSYDKQRHSFLKDFRESR